MTDNEFLKELVQRGSRADDGYFQYVHLVAVNLPKRLHEQLSQLVQNPVWDGDVISKSYRNELIDIGLAIRVCAHNQQGYTGATYFAWSVMNTVNDIKEGEVGA